MITFVPAGGLGNRMRAIASAIELAKDAKSELNIYWFQDWGLGCRFDDLFLPLHIDGVNLKEAAIADKLLFDRPRKKNLYLPKLFEKLIFDKCLYEEEVTSLYLNNGNFLSWCLNKNVYLSSCVYFYPPVLPNHLFDIFHPIPDIQKKIDLICSSFPESTVGVHIRRADHITAIQESPIELFIERMKQEPEDVSFYLATDSEEVKEEMKKIFGKRIITSPHKANRGNLQGMQDALTELYVLSHTNKIIGSSKSTYSESAAEIGNIHCEVMKKI